MKKLLCLLLAVVMLGSLLAGCGNSGTSNDAAKSTAEGTTVSTAGEKSQAETEESVTIKYFGWTNADTSLTESFDSFMQKYPNVKIEYDLVPNDQYMTVLKTKILGGESPDVFAMLVGTNLEQYAEAGYIADISSEPYLKDFGKSALDTTIYKGKVYGIPLKINASGVFYNKKMFADFGLSVPQSWEEFLDVSEKIKQKGIIPIAQGHKTAWTSLIIPYEILAQTAYYDNPNFHNDLMEGKEKFNGPGWNDALTKYNDLFKKGYFNKDFLATDYAQSAALLTERKAAMWIVPTWGLPLILKSGKDIQDFGVFPFKMKKENRPKSFGMVASAMTLSATTKYKEAANRFVEYWSTDEILAKHVGTQAIPTKTTLKPNYNPIIKDYVEQLDLNTDITSIDKGWPLGVQPIILKGYSEMFAAGRAPSEILADVDKEMERWKKEQGK